MSNATRNLLEYTEQYLALPFEPIQTEYRRKLVLSQILKFEPKRVLEVGCGARPLFTDLPSEIDVTVVEAAQTFADLARQMSRGRNGIHVLEGFIESVDLGIAEFDMIIVSCVLHEVFDPSTMLRTIQRHCSPSTVLHVNVPNAFSLHRMLAVAMGLISSPKAKSETQRLMQQRDVPYDVESLSSELSDVGFTIFEMGSLFVKPFTHNQMQLLVEAGFMTSEMLDGLDKLVQWLPDLGSEIWVNARKSS